MASPNDPSHEKNNSTNGSDEATDIYKLSQHSVVGESSLGFRTIALAMQSENVQNTQGIQNHHSVPQMPFINANYEENNNMDENSNDQAYEQYPDYHHHHYLAQQAQYSQQLPSSPADQCNQPFHVGTTPNSSSYSSLLQNSPPFSSSMSVTDYSRLPSVNDSSSTGDSSSQRSVRPRTSLPASQRRFSLTPSAFHNDHHSARSPIQTGSFTSWNSSQHSPSNSSNDTSMRYSNEHQASPDQCDNASLPRPSLRNSGVKGHRRNSSYDSGMSKLHEQEYRWAQLESNRLPTLPARSSYGGDVLQPLPPGSPFSAHRPRGSTETEREAELLLYNFTQEELQRERLRLPRDLADHPGLQECNLLRAGSELRRLADAFAATPARAKVRGMAEEVMFSALTWDNFASLCMQLFAGPQGITSERIVALFTFIADVAKQEIRRGAESCIRQLMAWSLRFIFEKVCQWVQRAGGWGRVLHQGLDVVYKMAMTAAALAAAAAMGVYVLRTLKHS